MPIKNIAFERSCWAEKRLATGIDEVGRGCFAGPVVAAAVTLFPDKRSTKLKDSKLLSEKELAVASAWIYKNAWIGYGIVSADLIDKMNIYQASMLAMKRAFWNMAAIMPQYPHVVLIDAVPLVLSNTTAPFEIHAIVKGESASISIAAASIVAKVYRDKLMRDLGPVICGYELGSHKGYGTACHQECIRRQGPSLIHRHSFKYVTHEEEQQSLW